MRDSIDPVEELPQRVSSASTRSTYIPSLLVQTESVSRLQVPQELHFLYEWNDEEHKDDAAEHEALQAHSDSLLHPIWRRSILGQLLSTHYHTGPVDILRLIDMLVRLEKIDMLPSLPVPSLRRGVQILVDYSEAMVPFRGDQEELRDAIIDLVGVDRSDTLYFVGTPELAGIGPQMDWLPYYPPQPGTPIVLLTDLGIGQTNVVSEHASVEDWLTFAAPLHDAGYPVIAFVPYATRRWPAQLRRSIRMIFWDQSTTITTVRYLAKQSKGID
jgi:hypothetical protein